MVALPNLDVADSATKLYPKRLCLQGRRCNHVVSATHLESRDAPAGLERWPLSVSNHDAFAAGVPHLNLNAGADGGVVRRLDVHLNSNRPAQISVFFMADLSPTRIVSIPPAGPLRSHEIKEVTTCYGLIL